MAPQHRGTVPPDHRPRLAAAAAAVEDAQAAYRRAVVDALAAGGSVREVAKATGLSTSTVTLWGHAGGWPTEQQRQGWAERKAVQAAALEQLGVDPDTMRRLAERLHRGDDQDT